jgi:hypothetical protein
MQFTLTSTGSRQPLVDLADIPPASIGRWGLAPKY